MTQSILAKFYNQARTLSDIDKKQAEQSSALSTQFAKNAKAINIFMPNYGLWVIKKVQDYAADQSIRTKASNLVAKFSATDKESLFTTFYHAISSKGFATNECPELVAVLKGPDFLAAIAKEIADPIGHKTPDFSIEQHIRNSAPAIQFLTLAANNNPNGKQAVLAVLKETKSDDRALNTRISRLRDTITTCSRA